MSNAKVSKLTKEEIEQAKASKVAGNPAASVSHAEQPAHRGSLYSTEYIKKLKIDEISAFFEKFDVVSCAKIPNDQEPKFVLVNCRDFNVVFSDYSFVFDFNGGYIYPDDNTPSKFDIQAFAKYCELIDQAPDQVIAEIMAVELFGQRFPSYSEGRKKAKLKEARLAYDALPKTMQKTLATAQEAKENEIIATHNKLYYGDYAGGPYVVGFANEDD